MKYWTWQIPEAYRDYITELGVEGHPLYDDFRRLQTIQNGALPQAYEIYPDTGTGFALNVD